MNEATASNVAVQFIEDLKSATFAYSHLVLQVAQGNITGQRRYDEGNYVLTLVRTLKGAQQVEARIIEMLSNIQGIPFDKDESQISIVRMPCPQGVAKSLKVRASDCWAIRVMETSVFDHSAIADLGPGSFVFSQEEEELSRTSELVEDTFESLPADVHLLIESEELGFDLNVSAFKFPKGVMVHVTGFSGILSAKKFLKAARKKFLTLNYVSLQRTRVGEASVTQKKFTVLLGFVLMG